MLPSLSAPGTGSRRLRFPSSWSSWSSLLLAGGNSNSHSHARAHYLPLNGTTPGGSTTSSPGDTAAGRGTQLQQQHNHHHHHHHCCEQQPPQPKYHNCHHHHHPSTDSISSQSTTATSWTGELYPSYPSNPYPSSPSKSIGYVIWLVKRALSLLIHAIVTLLAIYGLVMFVRVNVKQQYMPIPVYSSFQISQAGWDRRPYLVNDPVLLGGDSAAAAARVPPSMTTATATDVEEGDHPGTLTDEIQVQVHSTADDTPGFSSSAASPTFLLDQRTVLQLYDFDAEGASGITVDTSAAGWAGDAANGLDSTSGRGVRERTSDSHHPHPYTTKTKTTTTTTMATAARPSNRPHSKIPSLPSSPTKSIRDLHILILTPLKNSQEDLPTYLSLLTKLDHPKENTSLGFLIGDNDGKDATDEMIYGWILDQQRRNEYRKITLLKKSFGVIMPAGEARHKNWLQAQRRSLMAKARTTLLTSTLEPSVDWVLWLDVDLVEAPKSLIADLLRYGGAGVEELEGPAANVANVADEDELDRPPSADVITPNIMKRRGPGRLQGYDLNNWSETPKSIKMKAKLPAERMLWEGNRGRPTYRSHLARNWVQPNASASWDDREEGYTYMNRLTSKDLYQRLFLDRPHGERSDLFDESSDAYIGLTQELDGVGGVATLVRAETHRFGAIFPSWLEDHEVETEGFGVLAKKAGARIVGLPNYLVMHKSNEYTVAQ